MAVFAGETGSGVAVDAGGATGSGVLIAGNGVAVELVDGLAVSERAATAASELGGGGGAEAELAGGTTDTGGGVFETRSASSFSEGLLRMLCGPETDR